MHARWARTSQLFGKSEEEEGDGAPGRRRKKSDGGSVKGSARTTHWYRRLPPTRRLDCSQTAALVRDGSNERTLAGGRTEESSGSWRSFPHGVRRTRRRVLCVWRRGGLPARFSLLLRGPGHIMGCVCVSSPGRATLYYTLEGVYGDSRDESLPWRTAPPSPLLIGPGMFYGVTGVAPEEGGLLGATGVR